jgi:hypothetical protein
MFCWYLRNTYLENKLKVPGALTVCGVPVDLGKIDCPVFVYGSKEDHIVPWEAAFASMNLLNPKKAKANRFVLGASGHIAGVINPASKNKRSHWVNEANGRNRPKPRPSGLPARPSSQGQLVAGVGEVPGRERRQGRGAAGAAGQRALPADRAGAGPLCEGTAQTDSANCPAGNLPEK